jgi:DNA-binding response OmpR family regulator
MCTIALYERDDLMHSLLREWLTAAGYRVRGGTSGSAQPAANVSTAPSGADDPLDLVIVRITSPRQSAETSIRRVRSLHPTAPIIALSSQARSGLSSQGDAARALGVECLLAIPLARRELLSAVDFVLSRPRCANQSTASPDPKPKPH